MPNTDAILYIDDEKLNLEGFKLNFEEIYTVYIAESVEEVYKILSQHEIKVIVADQRMPEISGIELLESVKYKFPDITRIILTAFIIEEYLLEAINRGGVYRYLTKPWNFYELNAAIQGAIDTYNLKAENKILIKQLEEKINIISISEQKFRNIFDNSREGLIIIDGSKKIVNFNKALSDMTGYTIDEVVNSNFLRFIVPEYHEILLSRWKRMLADDILGLSECELLTKSGFRLFVEIKSSIIEYEGKPALLTVIHDITERMLFEKQLYITQAKAEEKERERIAKDLHDGIGPLLSTLKIYLYDIEKTEDRMLMESSLIKTNEIINEAISSVKEISNNISPHVLRNFGLPQAIRNFLEKLVIKPDINVHFNCNLNKRIDEIIEITLYRITTELVNNTIKYADAKNIKINIQINEKSISFKYYDDGKGFSFNALIYKGFGIQNIQSRVHAIDGRLGFISEEGKGVNVSIDVNF